MTALMARKMMIVRMTVSMISRTRDERFRKLHLDDVTDGRHQWGPYLERTAVKTSGKVLMKLKLVSGQKIATTFPTINCLFNGPQVRESKPLVRVSLTTKYWSGSNVQVPAIGL